MTNTHDGSHTWLKYLSRLKKQAEKEIMEEKFRSLFDGTDWSEEEKAIILKENEYD